jgi:hypothetical protein
MKIFNQKQLAITLLIVMVLPFVIFSVWRVIGDEGTAFPVPPVLALHTYAVLCASFFAGIQWGVHFCKRTHDSVYLLSFFTVLLAWVSLLKPGTSFGLAVMLLAFILSWIEEFRLSQQRVTTAWFWRVRTVSTILIILSLLLTISALESTGRVQAL